MIQGMGLESFDPNIKVKLAKELDNKVAEDDFDKESFQKVFSKVLEKGAVPALGDEGSLMVGEEQATKNGYAPNKVSDHIQLSDHPGKYAMMQNIDPENYEEGFEMFKQITASEFDPQKLPKPGMEELGMQNIASDIGLGVVG